ncbi:T9SS type A sorting domain-containing protein [bacterium]|nr:T9SS type A sorting domain-containing protein [bacterium]
MRTLYSVGLLLLAVLLPFSLASAQHGNYPEAQGSTTTETTLISVEISEESVLVSHRLQDEIFIKIYDSEGNLVVFESCVNEQIAIDFAQLKTGRYYYYISNNKGVHSAGDFTLYDKIDLAG